MASLAIEDGMVLGTDALPHDSLLLVESGDGGHAMEWVLFAVMSISAIGIWGVTFTKPKDHRANGTCNAILLTVAAFSYYAMAAKGGKVHVRVFNDGSVARTVYYARYVDWFLTTPLLLLDLLLMSGVAQADCIWILVADMGMILAGFFGAILPSKYKWGWYGIGCVLQLFIFWGLLFHARMSAMHRSRALGISYLSLTAYLMVFWTVYPVVWGLAEGSNTISVDAEIYWYGALDICTKVFFCWYILFFVEPQIEKVRHKEHWVPSVMQAPICAPLTGGDWTPGTAHCPHVASRVTTTQGDPHHDRVSVGAPVGTSLED